MRKPLLLGCFVASAIGVSATADAAQVRGRVTAQNKPVAGVTVSAQPYETPFDEARREARGEAEPAPLVSTTSAADGAFALALPTTQAEARNFLLTVSGAGIAPVRLDRLLESSRDEDVGDVAVARGQALAGRVVDTKGGPIVGAVVTLFAGSPTPARPLTTTTGPDGSFRFDRASEEGNRLRVDSPGFATLQRSGVRSGAIARPLALAFSVAVDGIVLMPDKRTPAAGAVVRIEGTVPSRWVETRQDGGFTVEGGAGAGAIVADAGGRGRGSAAAPPVGEKPTIVLAAAASVRGRVVDAATGAPIPGVLLAARTSAGAVLTGRTDPRGAYIVSGLASGSYTLLADEPGHVAWSREHVILAAGETVAIDVALVRAATLAGRVLDPEGRPVSGAWIHVLPNARGSFDMFLLTVQWKNRFRSGPDGTFKAPRLEPGNRQSATVSHDDFESRTVGGIDLLPGATRSITVTLPRGHFVRGIVKDDDGQPVAGAEIQLNRSANFHSRGGQMSMFFAGGMGSRSAIETGPDGRFEVKGLETGDYQLAVSKRGFAKESVDPLKVTEGASAGPAEIVLHAGATVGGLVRTRSGTGVAGYRVMARSPGGGGPGAFSTMTPAPTGPDGVFSIEGLRIGEPYDLLVVREGGGPGAQGTRVTPPVDGVELLADGSGRIRGTVLDADGRPVSDFDASYSFPPGGGPRMMFGFSSDSIPAGSSENPLTVHAEDGSFVLEDVPAGRWNVDVRAKGYQPGAAASVTVDEGGSSDAGDIRLSRGVAIRGQVLESRSGRPVSDAVVEAKLSHESSFFFGISNRANPNAANTDAAGRFEILGLPPGTYSVTAKHPDWTEDSATVDLKDQPASVDLRMGKGGTVTGVVLSGGRGVASASVALNPSGGDSPMFGMGGRSAFTDDAGRFSFDRLKSGRYAVTAELRGQSSPPVEALITSPDATQDVTLTMAAGATIRGTVSGLAEEERAGVRVNASGAENFFASARAAADGSFEISGAPVGVLSLNATAGDFMRGSHSARTSVTVAEGQTEVAADISFEGGFRVEGHVTRGGRPVADARVFANGPAGMGASDQTDEAGAFSLEGVKEGLYTLWADSSAGQAQAKVEVKGDTTVDIEIPAARIAGMVVEAASGRPLGDVTIACEAGAAGFTWINVKSDSAGRFTVEGLEAKAYRLSFRKPAYQTEIRELTPSESAEVTIDMRHGEGMAIEVHDGIFGMALRGVTVRIFDAQGSVFFGPVALDSDGRGEIPALAPGTYRFRIAAEGYAPTSLPAVIVPAAPIVITLTPGGTVEVQVGPETLAKPGASGRILNPDGSPYSTWDLPDEGKITFAGPTRRIENVPPGHYLFAVEGGPQKEFDVREGASTIVSLP